MNEKGLAVGVLLIDTEATDQRTDRVDITTTTAIRMMLDRCATVDEAVATAPIIKFSVPLISASTLMMQAA